MPQPDESLFRVLPRQENVPVATALREWLPGQSWSQIHRLLKNRRVMVSGNLCLDPARRLTLRDVVKVLSQPAAPPPTADSVRIRFVDEHVVVVEKPAGVTTTRHAEERDWSSRRRQIQPTLDEMLPRILAKRQHGKAKGRALRVRPVHRIDRETSGLLVFARTVVAERNLGQQFRQHTTHRRYLAVVQGAVAEQTITSRLVRDRGDGRRGSTTNPQLGKSAVTHVKPLERIGDYTLVECVLETGRTHQIRIHLAENGHPLCGEKVYNQPLRKPPLPDPSGAPRLVLHAAELGFQHPVTGEMLRFEMPLPDDFHEFLRRLRRESHDHSGK